MSRLVNSSLFEQAREAEQALLHFRGRSAASLGRSELIRVNSALSILAAASSRGFRPNPMVLSYSTGSGVANDLPIDQISLS